MDTKEMFNELDLQIRFTKSPVLKEGPVFFYIPGYHFLGIYGREIPGV